jgi:glycine cleavage system H protein
VSDHVVFMMGEYEARFPTDRGYSKMHLWAECRGGTTCRFGFTAFATRLMGEVYFLEWQVAPGAVLEPLREVGSIESKKAESCLYAPLAGRLLRLNDALMSDPSAIGTDPYQAGWLFEIESDIKDFLSASQYVEHLASIWEITQRMIKGQFNS